jgi:hypothetical protein
MPLLPIIALLPLALHLLFALSLLSTNTAASLCYLLRKLLTACPKVAVILLAWADGPGRATRVALLSLSKSLQLIAPVSPTALRVRIANK